MTESDVRRLEAELVAGIGDGIIIADRDGVIVSWNRGAASIFGYAAEEVLGERLDVIIPERLRERHWAGYDATMATGATSYADRMLAVPAQHRDGRRLSIEFRVVLLDLEMGRPKAIGAIIRDVTERWNAERELRARIAELEEAAASTPGQQPRATTA